MSTDADLRVGVTPESIAQLFEDRIQNAILDGDVPVLLRLSSGDDLFLGTYRGVLGGRKSLVHFAGRAFTVYIVLFEALPHSVIFLNDTWAYLLQEEVLVAWTTMTNTSSAQPKPDFFVEEESRERYESWAHSLHVWVQSNEIARLLDMGYGTKIYMFGMLTVLEGRKQTPLYLKDGRRLVVMCTNHGDVCFLSEYEAIWARKPDQVVPWSTIAPYYNETE